MTDSPPADPRVDVVARTVSYQGHFRVETYRLRHRRFNETWTEVMAREVFVRPPAAAVIPYDPARDAVVLIEQFRTGAYVAGVEPWLIEVVAGIIEPGEQPEEVARREAVEEAGCDILALEPIGRILPSPGADSELLHLYCGRIDSAGVGGLHGLDHEHEDIRATVLPFKDAFVQVTQTAVTNANALIALQWLALNRDRLRRQWR
ncbi:MAG TPA: NUDIX domain-containing protein [Kiloniellales bacterium]|jgi:ADP-ribose pyrophosphatase